MGSKHSSTVHCDYSSVSFDSVSSSYQYDQVSHSGKKKLSSADFTFFSHIKPYTAEMLVYSVHPASYQKLSGKEQKQHPQAKFTQALSNAITVNNYFRMVSDFAYRQIKEETEKFHPITQTHTKTESGANTETTTAPSPNSTLSLQSFPSSSLSLLDIDDFLAYGGRGSFRSMHRMTYKDAPAIIFLLSAKEVAQATDGYIAQLNNMFHSFLFNPSLANRPVLMLLFDCESSNAVRPQRLVELLDWTHHKGFEGRHWRVQSCSFDTHAGLLDGLTWLGQATQKYNPPQLHSKSQPNHSTQKTTQFPPVDKTPVIATTAQVVDSHTSSTPSEHVKTPIVTVNTQQDNAHVVPAAA